MVAYTHNLMMTIAMNMTKEKKRIINTFSKEEQEDDGGFILVDRQEEFDNLIDEK